VRGDAKSVDAPLLLALDTFPTVNGQLLISMTLCFAYESLGPPVPGNSQLLSTHRYQLTIASCIVYQSISMQQTILRMDKTTCG
jgi:hypothetical protein